jgi:hypothetical protein
MFSIVLFIAIVGFCYWQGWFLAGAIIVGLVAVNGMLAAVMAVLNPRWYAARRAAELGEPEYLSLFGPTDDLVQRDIRS